MKRLLAAILICSQLVGCAGSFPLEHTAIALGTTAAGETMGNCWAGAAVGSALLVSREYTQAEYRWIERYGNGQRSNMPAFAAFDSRVWDQHSLTDWIIPTIAAFGTCTLIHAYKKGWLGFKF